MEPTNMTMCDAPKGNKATKQYGIKEATDLANNASQQKADFNHFSYFGDGFN